MNTVCFGIVRAAVQSAPEAEVSVGAALAKCTVRFLSEEHRHAGFLRMHSVLHSAQ